LSLNYFLLLLSFCPATRAAISSEAASSREAVRRWFDVRSMQALRKHWMLEVVNARYAARKAVEYMQCCGCGEIVKIVLEA